MDGAARFNQRDSLATILITAINIVAGFLIGVFQLDIPFREALKTYTILTVGDGLVTMIPSLLVSVGGGIVVTRSSSRQQLGSDVSSNCSSQPSACGSPPESWRSGPDSRTAQVCFPPDRRSSRLLARRADKESEKPSATAADGELPRLAQLQPPASRMALEGLLKLDDLGLEVGYGLVPLVDAKQGGQLLQRVQALRKHLALQLGFIVPPVHITDNLKLKPREYVVFLRGVEIARWEMREDCLLAISSESEPPELQGIDTREPAFGVAAHWIVPGLREQALAAGYAVVDQTSVMATHLAEVIKQHAHELLTRQETKRLLDRLGESHPKLFEELVPKLLRLGEVQKVLQQLLREQVSIRDLGTILETLLDTAVDQARIRCCWWRRARQALGRALVRPLLSDDGGLHVVTLDPEHRRRTGAGVLRTGRSGAPLRLSPRSCGGCWRA